MRDNLHLALHSAPNPCSNTKKKKHRRNGETSSLLQATSDTDTHILWHCLVWDHEWEPDLTARPSNFPNGGRRMDPNHTAKRDHVSGRGQSETENKAVSHPATLITLGVPCVYVCEEAESHLLQLATLQATIYVFFFFELSYWSDAPLLSLSGLSGLSPPRSNFSRERENGLLVTRLCALYLPFRYTFRQKCCQPCGAGTWKAQPLPIHIPLFFGMADRVETRGGVV